MIIFTYNILGGSSTLQPPTLSLERLKSKLVFHSQAIISKDGIMRNFCGMKLHINDEEAENEGILHNSNLN